MTNGWILTISWTCIGAWQFHERGGFGAWQFRTGFRAWQIHWVGLEQRKVLNCDKYFIPFINKSFHNCFLFQLNVVIEFWKIVPPWWIVYWKFIFHNFHIKTKHIFKFLNHLPLLPLALPSSILCSYSQWMHHSKCTELCLNILWILKT